MKVSALFSLALTAGIAVPVFADPPAQFPVPATKANPNQTLADEVAFHLRTTGTSAGADIGISVQEGTITLSGTAKGSAQKAKIVADVKAVAGVVLVRDGIRVVSVGVVQVQDPPTGLPPVSPGPLSPIGPGLSAAAPSNADPLAAAPPAGVGPGNPLVEPVPLGVAGQAAPDMQAPNLPPYSWPTYAPYNNVSRVAYPQAYPYNAFPFIGPYYPFPKVPLGWRKVTMEWEDGHWYYGRNSTPHDYWRVKFW